MVGAAPCPEMGDLKLAPLDLDSRVLYFPVRHHSPACAWHLGRLIRRWRPDAVLIEGPRDATPLIPFLLHPRTRCPVALFTTCVRSSVDRHAAYYPLCDYSPEMEAIRAGAEVGARLRFIDLTFPEQIAAETGRTGADSRSLLEEHYYRHSRFLAEAARRAGSRDADDLWDHLYETDYERKPVERFVSEVATYCALARRDYTPEMLEAEGNTCREAAMAAAVAEEEGRVVVVTGGFHTVVLPGLVGRMPSPAPPGEALVLLMRYSFERLDRLNGYASGMPSPEFYQRRWDGRAVEELLVEIAREVKGVSTADSIEALAQIRRLAQFRGHPQVSREDLLDGIRSAFVKGDQETEGAHILARARKLLAGERVGDVPPEAGQAPLLLDFRNLAESLRLILDSVSAREIPLDLYRSRLDRDRSRFFHRLAFLGVPFGRLVRGPDFVTGADLDRIQEVWSYAWSPTTESTLQERSVYGSTLEEASTAALLERFARAEEEGAGRRADVAVRLVLEGCRMGLHRHTGALLERAGDLLAQDTDFASVVGALEGLLVLRFSREPLEAHHLAGVPELADSAYQRACYLLPELVRLPEKDSEAGLRALNVFEQAACTLAGEGADAEPRRHGLETLFGTVEGNATLRGGAAGLLFGSGWLEPHHLVVALRGMLLASAQGGADFLRGLLGTGRSALWQVPELIAALHEVLAEWSEEAFLAALPRLRLGFSDLSPRETHRVADAVAAHAGVGELRAGVSEDFEESDLLRAVRVNADVLEQLRRDGLEAFLDG
ncbi:MAG: hypothetical protein HY319_08840 [Armatimonadetes bacterium]|nr:hypothetical protein [Armatimonadota bacterium]